MNRVMFRVVGVLALFAATLASNVVRADVPKTINHQGLITVNGTRFTGTGLFRFAIFDPSSGRNIWTNNNTFVPGPGMPTAAVSITVTDGVYSVELGNTALTNMSSQLPPSAFGNGSYSLRIWFDDGVNGNQQLSPDHKLTSTPYAFQAQFQPPIGSIMAWHKSMPGTPALPDGWVECNGQTVSDNQSPYNGQFVPDLNHSPDPSINGGPFLRGSTVSGVMQLGSLIFSQTVSGPPHGDCFPAASGAWVEGGDGSYVYDTGTNYHCSNSLAEGGTQFKAYEYVKPTNMSVVWIIRVK